MAASPKIYHRLPGRGLVALQQVRLYRAPDHLLLIASNGFTESYKRFYFRDIQAITIQKTHIGKIWNAVWGSFASIFLFSALGLGGAAGIVMGCIAAIFALALLASFLMGPSCACYLRTAVQTERFTPVTRVSAARKLLARIRPFIEQLQGPISKNELVSQ